ncbi:LADA_0G11870g1_1 [Lachancea dasiensis]|uniref:LADA_0G11870g1_1 n=1 Tax=Lachancea dasiensis TaxID=1072105 RepID=A0A1G4JV33_9SACH|nr:LADA_0G11870g1_1 [Lachancea dasiensis]
MSKTYFVSGANRGIGFSFVKELSSDSTNTVIATARNVETAAELKSWADAHSNVKLVQLDVASAESVQAAAKTTQEITPKGIDVLISNAGIAKSSDPVLGLSDDLYLEHFVVNTLGPIRLIRAFKSLLDKKATKEVLAITSIVGSVGTVMPLSTSGYGLSKAGLNYAFRQLQQELSPEGYSFALVHPGLVGSDMGNEFVEGLDPDVREQFLNTLPLITPDQSASAINKNVLQELKSKNFGKFLSYDGSELVW